MFLPYIITFVLLLVSFAYMATSGTVTKSAETRMNFAKVKFTYPKEEVLVTGVESLCQIDGAYCASKYDDTTDTITLTLADLNGYIPQNFQNDNGLGGSFGDITITDNNTTINITHNIDDDHARYIYLRYYEGAKYGEYPVCVSGNKDSQPPCDTSDVKHSYPTSLDLRISLENS